MDPIIIIRQDFLNRITISTFIREEIKTPLLVIIPGIILYYLAESWITWAYALPVGLLLSYIYIDRYRMDIFK